MPRVASALSFKVSVAMQNKSMDSMYSMGIVKETVQGFYKGH